MRPHGIGRITTSTVVILPVQLGGAGARMERVTSQDGFDIESQDGWGECNLNACKGRYLTAPLAFATERLIDSIMSI